uniref:Thioredoxin domain-containing protein n=1 Tax=Periophthalmus magnuspinnatus TaxID=409849 RepID=A0A3B3ZD21_9GOBI
MSAIYQTSHFFIVTVLGLIKKKSKTYNYFRQLYILVTNILSLELICILKILIYNTNSHWTACQQLQPTWKEFADWGDDMGVNIAKVDVTEQPGLSGRFIITSLPTIYHCKDGIFRKYHGPRTKDDFLSFVDEQKWKSIEPISSWFGPSSFLMNAMSALFKLSMFIRRCHNYMTDEVGIPNWGSYVIFGLVTLFSGLALGLVSLNTALHHPVSYVYLYPFVISEKQAAEQARLMQDDEHEADGEEEDEEDEDEVWRRRRAPQEGRSENIAQPTDGALRKRAVRGRGAEEEDESES